MELLEAILTVMKCEDTEQLKKISQEKKARLAYLIEERVPGGLAPIEEWNELLALFMGAQPEQDNETAKKKLLCYLRGEENKEAYSSDKA